MPTERALVTGANGFIGSHLAEELLRRGVSVRALVRRSADLRFVPPGAERVVGDVTDPLSLPPAVAGVDVVYHVAGLIASFRRQAFAEVNAGGTRGLVLACRKAAPGLRRFVLVSSLAAAGPSRSGRPVREDDPPRPVSEYGRSKLLAERLAFDAAAGLPVTVVRPPVVYGPRDRGMLEFFRMAAAGFAPVFRPEKYYSLIHCADLVRGIADAGAAEGAAGRVYHLAEGKAWSAGALLGEIASAVGGRVRRVPVPEPLLRFLGPAADRVVLDLGLRGRPVADKVHEILPRFWIADTRRAAADLGFAACRPLSEGIRETAEFYRAAGWIPRRSC